MFTKLRKPIYAVSILSGTVVGVGLFSLPYITSKVGLWIMLGYFFVLGGVAVVVHLLFAEVSLHTPDFLRLPGFAGIHLGKRGYQVAITSTCLGLLGTILAYLIAGGRFLAALLAPFLVKVSPMFDGNNIRLYTLAYFALGALLIYFGVRAIAKAELLGLLLFFIIIVFIFIRGLPYFQLKNLFPVTDMSKLFLPYGAVLFSLWGASLIPELEEVLGKQKVLLKKLIPVAILIPIFIYLFFIIAILGIMGPRTSETAIEGLENVLGRGVASVGFLFGLLTTFTSFIALGLTLKKVFWFDLKLDKRLAWVITCFVPLILFLTGFRHFVAVVSLVGGLMLGINGILIVLMYQKVKKSEGKKVISLTSPLILIFGLGVVYELYAAVRFIL